MGRNGTWRRSAGFAAVALAFGLAPYLPEVGRSCAAKAGPIKGACDWAEPANNELQVDLVRETVFNNILLCVEVNGRAGLMILDTGSSTTFVSPGISGIPLLSPNRTVTPLKGSGWVSSGQWGEANIHIGGHRWINRRVVVDDMRTISKALGQQVDGILGEDLLSQYRSVIINYNDNRLILIDR